MISSQLSTTVHRSRPHSKADDDDISSGAEVDQFFKSAGSVISDETGEGNEETPAKPAKKPRRVVPASTSLKPIIDLRVKKPKSEKPAELNVVASSDDDDSDDGEEDFTAGFPGTGVGDEARDEPKPRRKMMPGLANAKKHSARSSTVKTPRPAPSAVVILVAATNGHAAVTATANANHGSAIAPAGVTRASARMAQGSRAGRWRAWLRRK